MSVAQHCAIAKYQATLPRHSGQVHSLHLNALTSYPSEYNFNPIAWKLQDKVEQLIL